MRIFDPTKVTRLSLQDAASVAGLQPTTEVMLAEVPKEKECEKSGGTPGMSGMDM